MQQAVETTRHTTIEKSPNTTTERPAPSRALTADVVRVVLFTGVVVAHSVNGINNAPEDIRAAGLVGVLLHLTRYGFVAVTLFVLVLSMRGRTMSPTTFWRRRFGLVVWPYLAWTLVYSITDHLVIAGNPFPDIRSYATGLAQSVVTGDGKYQLYFLLISMQIYLVFPLLARLLARNAHRPWRLIIAGAVIQVTMFVVYQYLPRPTGRVWDAIYEHAWQTLPMYALFIAIGAVTAQHHAAVESWLRIHAIPVLAAGLVGSSVSVGAYLLATGPADVPLNATTPWNPLMLPWLVGGLVMLWLGAMLWDDLRAAGHQVGSAIVSAATLRAFGVFAVHPLILDVLARIGLFDALYTWFPSSASLRTTVLTVLTLALSLLLVDVLLRTPLSRWLVGRERITLRPLRWRRTVAEA